MSHELFEPTVGAYLGYCAGFCLRYFALAGGAYFLVYVAFKRRTRAYRIQEQLPSLADISYEVRWSMSNMACTGLSSLFLYHLVQAGLTPMYYALAERGWLYFGLSVVLGILAYDAWFYWQHRLLHTPWLFRNVHCVHHRASNPTPLAGFAHHPLETFMSNAFFVVLVSLLPLHPIAFGLIGLYLFGVAIVSHLGYEFFWDGFTRHRLFRLHGTSTHHNMHHRQVGWNYSICLTYWDRLMGTMHPEYDRTFDAVRKRARRMSGVGLEGSARMSPSPSAIDTRHAAPETGIRQAPSELAGPLVTQ